MSETFRRDLHELRGALLNAAAVRDLRDHFDTASGELGWVLHERHVMLDTTNRLRASRGILPVDEDAVLRIETSASGHIDYVLKFAIGCAELANDLIDHHRAGAPPLSTAVRRSLEERQDHQGELDSTTRRSGTA